MKKSLLLLIILLPSILFAQQNIFDDSRTISLKKIIPQGRRQVHFDIERQQKSADYADGVLDSALVFEDYGNNYTDLIFNKFNEAKALAENNFEDDRTIRSYLNVLLQMLKNLNRDLDKGTINELKYNNQLKQYREVIEASKNKNLESYVTKNITKFLFSMSSVFENEEKAFAALMNGISEKNPELIFHKLKTFQDENVQQNLVSNTAKLQPKYILNYATSTSIENSIVRKSKDPRVLAIIDIADKAKKPLKAVMFIDDVENKKLSIDEINKITNNDQHYFSALVKRKKDIPALKSIYEKEIAQECKLYVSETNALHNSSNEVRFKSVNFMNAHELYYLIVFGGDELYTSSYLGLYKRWTEKLKPEKPEVFFEKINLDRFKTFIRLAANFNVLGEFLNGFEKTKQKELLENFVSGLENTSYVNYEDATDVANALASIQDKDVKTFLSETLLKNKNNFKNKDKNAHKVYHILYTMLDAKDSSVSNDLGIPSATVFPFSKLVNDSGIVYQQIFFYGDQDGKGVFNSYLNHFPAPQWKTKRKENWVEIESMKGKKIIIFANIPFDEPKDEYAQKALRTYLNDNNIYPTIIIHRGHSYHLSGTLENITSHHKFVFLGACGGYLHLNEVLKRSNDAHILSTKQIGSGSINAPMLDYVNAKLLLGKDLDWVEMWNHFGKIFGGGQKALFDDYIPPHKNLAALFLKAYRQGEVIESEELIEEVNPVIESTIETGEVKE